MTVGPFQVVPPPPETEIEHAHIKGFEAEIEVECWITIAGLELQVSVPGKWVRANIEPDLSGGVGVVDHGGQDFVFIPDLTSAINAVDERIEHARRLRGRRAKPGQLPPYGGSR